MITFSIITVTFNAEKVVETTLKSVVRQTYGRVEHLIIDGQSSDRTCDIVRSYQERLDNQAETKCLSLVSEPDKGIYDAMNKGLATAQGDFVCFINAGDAFRDSEVLERIAARVEHEGDGDLPAIIYGDTDIVDYDGRFLAHRHLSAPHRLKWTSFRKGMLVCHQAFYVRRDIAAAIPYDLRYRFSADIDWCIRVMKEADAQGADFLNMNEVLANYLYEGQTTRNHRASLKERFAVMRTHYGLLPTVLMHLWFAVRKPFLSKF
ncbi:MAG: glycosyltransferase family 2 protein [Prevotellaceae bacterium]|nr:glycosyltransferase [Prevotella sp.]MDD7529865.1 glycosyltransferase family 2 protein [Prevotellaceae bacterium]MDY2634491.1 glycosyltransferase family 2 protein [Prevotella sp.]